MNKRFLRLAVLAMGLAAAACDAGSNEPLLARVGDYRLTVGEVVRMLAGRGELPNDTDVVDAVANIWVDYTLLADAASRDTTFQDVDFGPLVRQEMERIAIQKVQGSLIPVDSTTTEEELRAHFEQNSTGLQWRARHILLMFPEQATDAQRDSVREAVLDLRERIEGGESFEDVAQQYSQDTSSGARGGDLGYFGPTDMLPTFEAGVRATGVGELSDPVQTQYGYHLIRVDERNQPSFEEAIPQVTQEVLAERRRAAEDSFIADLDEQASVEYAEDAADLTREIARNPATTLGRRARKRVVAEYDGGTLTLGEVQDALLASGPQLRSQIEGTSDADIEDQLLVTMVRRELLVAEAEERGAFPGEEVRDSLADLAVDRFRQTARTLNFLPLGVAEGESREEAVQTAVIARLEGVVQGALQMVDVTPITFVLKKQTRTAIYPDGIERAVQRIATVRPSAGAPSPTPQGQSPSGESTLPPVPDEGGGG